MFNYQTTNTTVNLSFSKEFLSSSEVVKFIETLRIKELLSKSQLTTEDALKLDDELKEEWWQKNQARFLEKISQYLFT
jgi:hypothetical protein